MKNLTVEFCLNVPVQIIDILIITNLENQNYADGNMIL